jgi:hypothetical protein
MSADLSISSDDPVNPLLNVPLNGNGIPQSPYILSVLKNGTGSGTVTSTPSGVDCGGDCSEYYSSGTAVTLTASPAGGSIFGGWSGACSGTGTCQVTMNSNTTVIASFIPDPGGGGGGTLTVIKNGTGSGTVTSTPSGVDCGGDCSESYSDGTVVTLTASPGGGSIFAGWSGACSGTGTCQVTMNSNTTVIASFIPDPGGGGGGTLTVNKNGTGSGTVTSTPSGIDCGADCSESYSDGTVVTLTASPAGGSIFGGWSGACSGTGTCQVTMNSNTTVIASFIPDPGGGGSINYTPINLTQNGATYDGSIPGVIIGPNEQRFYSVTRPASCNAMMQIAIAGTGPANPDMLVSSSDFGTAGEALSLYQNFLNTTGYEVNTVDVIGGTTYWYWFAASFESEYVPIFPPSDSTYYIEVVNADSVTGNYRIEAHCW